MTDLVPESGRASDTQATQFALLARHRMAEILTGLADVATAVEAADVLEVQVLALRPAHIGRAYTSVGSRGGRSSKRTQHRPCARTDIAGRRAEGRAHIRGLHGRIEQQALAHDGGL